MKALTELTLMMSGVMIFGLMEENTVISGAGLVFSIVVVCDILATEYLKQINFTFVINFDLQTVWYHRELLDICNFNILAFL